MHENSAKLVVRLRTLFADMMVFVTISHSGTYFDVHSMT